MSHMSLGAIWDDKRSEGQSSLLLRNLQCEVKKHVGVAWGDTAVRLLF